MLTRLKKLAALLILAQSSVAIADPVLMVDSSGQLVGATNVEVNSELFDVMFVDGTCIDVFDDCNEPGDFAFTTEPDALVASEALLTMVLLDGVSGSFDSLPDLTAGCELPIFCAILTPFEATGTGFVRQAGAVNGPDDSGDFFFGSDTQSITDDLGSDDGAGPIATWAVWSRSPVAVPEPGTLALLVFGLFGIGAARRKLTTRI